ncbi:hypothetical protein GDO81_008252 [Engystomops pustulosus]|uniref:Uncharacterized protein n=1 Tax=Engystomops pustulosus TaxID=76066 RepID=A0AAV7CF81_ENGPU|nr:hypothetical protein GDO81_008252 [Engystomops pustulosus]
MAQYLVGYRQLARGTQLIFQTALPQSTVIIHSSPALFRWVPLVCRPCRSFFACYPESSSLIFCSSLVWGKRIFLYGFLL